MKETVKIGNIEIGDNYKPFIIAEMSGNHNQSLDRALALVDAAAEAGAHALKLQTYTADTITMKGAYKIEDANSLWNGKELHDLYKQAYTPWNWHEAIFNRAKEKGMLAFSSPFDESSVDFLEKLNVPCYKIASFENTDLPLIRRVAATGKPLIISTGMASMAELDDTVKVAREGGCKDLVLLKCTSTYPATADNTNILTIPHMRELFECEVGLSDHTMGIGVSVASIALGATVIEKHFTLSRSDGGVDSAFSMEPIEMAQLVSETERAWQAMGQVSYGAIEAEQKSIVYRRSLYIVKDLKAGDMLTRDNVRAIRPGLGLATKYLEVLIGRRVKKDVERGTAIDWTLIN